MKHEPAILIADDQKHILALLKATLAGTACRILTVSSGEDALLQASSTRIDLLLIDFEMSGLTGVQTVRHLRESPIYANLPIIMITGRGQNNIRIEATCAGVTLVIPKPFSPRDLLETVQRLLAESETAAGCADPR